MITEHDYDYIKFGESVIMITITQKIVIDYDYNRNQPQPCSGCTNTLFFSANHKVEVSFIERQLAIIGT